MKKLVTILSLSLIVSFASAQTTGPKAKNTPTYKKKGSISMTTTGRQSMAGPKAKNNFLESVDNGGHLDQPTKEKLSGPKAKNYKPWRN